MEPVFNTAQTQHKQLVLLLVMRVAAPQWTRSINYRYTTTPSTVANAPTHILLCYTVNSQAAESHVEQLHIHQRLMVLTTMCALQATLAVQQLLLLLANAIGMQVMPTLMASVVNAVWTVWFQLPTIVAWLWHQRLHATSKTRPSVQMVKLGITKHRNCVSQLQIARLPMELTVILESCR